MVDTMTYGVAHTNKKKCLILSKGKRNYMWYMYKMKIGFLTLILKITCVKKKGVLPTLCQIIQNYVKSSVRLVDYSYVDLVKSIVDMTNSNANLVKFKGAKVDLPTIGTG